MVAPERRTALLKQLVSAARALVTYQVGFPVACARLDKIQMWLQPDVIPQLSCVREYLEAVRSLPLGSERLAWDRAALRVHDRALEAENQRYRDAVFEACYQIIDQYDPPERAALTGGRRPAD
jgi:hypothetical protein